MSIESLAENISAIQAETSPQQGTVITGAATLRDCVEKTLSNYFTQLDGADTTDVYNLVLNEVEAPLLEQVMRYCRNNQTKASVLLGLNRGTLRKKLKQYDLL